ncbi:hypothetical protein Aduo_000464 [Ancylostoma duodenale]
MKACTLQVLLVALVTILHSVDNGLADSVDMELAPANVSQVSPLHYKALPEPLNSLFGNLKLRPPFRRTTLPPFSQIYTPPKPPYPKEPPPKPPRGIPRSTTTTTTKKPKRWLPKLRG